MLSKTTKFDVKTTQNHTKSHKITQNHTKSHKITQNHTLNFPTFCEIFFAALARKLSNLSPKNQKKRFWGWKLQKFITFAPQLMPRWRNGRRARFRCECWETCRFDSYPGHTKWQTARSSRTKREFSSAGSEHLPYKQRVGGSNPSTPTKKRFIAGLRWKSKPFSLLQGELNLFKWRLAITKKDSKWVLQ